MTADRLLETSEEVERVAPRRFEPYPEYRASGVEWLGEVPAHWAVAPVYSRYEVALGKMLDAKRISGHRLAPYLRNVDVQWDRVNCEGLPEMDFEQTERQRYALRLGDALVCEGGEVGRTALWRGELSECYYQKAVHRVRPRRETERVRFFFYTMYALAQSGVFAAGGEASTISHLTAVRLRHYRFVFPSAEEQQVIANVLDRETAEIDALVAQKERLIELLREKRAALITRAVTKGLDPGVAMKDSGVEWLGEIPAHWEVLRTKFVARLESGHTPSRSHPEYWEDCTVPWFALADVWQIREGLVEYVHETAEKISELGLANSAARLLPKGTVMLSRTASVGFSAIMGTAMATTQDFVNWVCGPRMVPEFLLYVFRSMKPEFKHLTMGSTHQTIYMPDVGRFVTPVPPVEEQQRIVGLIRRETAKLDALANKIRLGIERLREFRTALISAAVTGKIDVREAACD